jgi:serine/threonine protein kinase/Tfp pilus assembly protein PilF
MDEQKELFSHRYELKQKIGEGGLGEVFRAYDLWNKKELALKILKEKIYLEKFKKEFEYLTLLSHPGLVKAFDFFYTFDKTPYFAMELVQGKDLDKIDFKSDFKRLFPLSIKICEILEYIHSQSLVHCDLKLENFKITSDPFGIKLLDFGLAEKMGVKSSEGLKGTIQYMAPECFKKLPLDERSDLYSFGVILYELTTGQRPFDAKDPVRLITSILEKEPISPKKLNDLIPEGFDKLILNLLEKSPHRRISSASELKQKLFFLSGRKPKRGVQLNAPTVTISHLSSGGMVGNEKEFNKIKDDLKNSIKSPGKFVLLEGETGVGKSTFLHKLKLFSQFEGILFVEANCFKSETYPYQPIKEVLFKLIPYIQDRDPHLLGKYENELSLIVPATDSLSEKSLKDLSQSRFSERIASFLIEASESFPFVLCLEDIHWAKEGCLKILQFLTERISQSKIFLIISVRTEELESHKSLKQIINRFIGSSLSGKDFELIKLGRLNQDETKELVFSKLAQKEPPTQLVDYVYKNSSGNPLYVLEILRLLLEKKVVLLDDQKLRINSKGLKALQIPSSLEKIWLKNLSRLDSDSSNLLKLAALSWKGFDLDSIKFLTGYSEEKIFEILYGLLKDELLTQSPMKSFQSLWYEFSNQGLKQTLYLKIPLRKRTEWHKKMGYFLEQKGEDVEEIAHHFIRSDDYAKAFFYSMLAAQKSAEQFASQETTEDYVKSALAFAKRFDLPEKEKKKIEALIFRGDFFKDLGELNDALQDYHSILSLVKGKSDKKTEAKIYRELGEIYRLKHDYKNGLLCLRKAQKLYQDLQDQQGLARTLNNIGNLLENVLWPYQKALKIYEKIGDKQNLAVTLNNIGVVYLTNHQYQKAFDYFNQSLTLHGQLGNKMEVARGLNNAGIVLVLLGKCQQAIKAFSEALELNEKMGNKKEVCYNLENLAEAYQRKWEHNKVFEYCQRGLKLAREIDFSQREGQFYKISGISNLEVGNYHKSYSELNEALKIAEGINDKELKAEVLINQAKLFLWLNHNEKAEQNLSEAKKVADLSKDKRLETRICHLLGIYHLKNNRIKEAENLLTDALRIAEDLKIPDEEIKVSLDLWELYLNSGEIQTANDYLGQTKKLLEQSEDVPYKSHFYFNLAKTKWLENKSFGSCGNKDALKFLSLALEEAKKSGRIELLWKIHHTSGKWYMELSELEKGYKELEKAKEILKTITDNIKDPDLKESYLKDEEKLALFQDIKEITQILVGKES